jgi:photosystem II stability/assembly factor-like uncharacterized protein
MNMNNLMLLSSKGILDVEGNPDTRFHNRLVHTGARINSKLAVIVDRTEIWIHNESWELKVSSNIDLNCLLWINEDKLLVGTAQARLAWLMDSNLEFIESFDSLPERNSWDTPWGGPPDVRSLALSSDGTIYVNIHVGWVVKSHDSGKTWQPLQNGLEKDVHQVSAHPTKGDTVFAATADGFHISKNEGKEFSRKWKGFRHTYQRATACFLDKDVYLVSVSRGSSGGNSRLYRSLDEGDTWNMVNGLPDKINRNINTYQITVGENGNAYVVVDTTKLYRTTDYGDNWKLVKEGYPKLYQII